MTLADDVRHLVKIELKQPAYEDANLRYGNRNEPPTIFTFLNTIAPNLFAWVAREADDDLERLERGRTNSSRNVFGLLIKHAPNFDQASQLPLLASRLAELSKGGRYSAADTIRIEQMITLLKRTGTYLDHISFEYKQGATMHRDVARAYEADEQRQIDSGEYGTDSVEAVDLENNFGPHFEEAFSQYHAAKMLDIMQSRTTSYSAILNDVAEHLASFVQKQQLTNRERG